MEFNVSALSNVNYENAAELVEIPSHGIFYSSVTTDPDILERGSLRIRAMTIIEEKILTNSRLVKTGQALDLVFRNCVKSKIDPGELLSTDRVFIMLWLRSISYGNVYKFKIESQDPSHPGKFDWSVDLAKQPIKECFAKSIKEPFIITLPQSGHTIEFRLPRGKDEVDVIKTNYQHKLTDEINETISKQLLYTIQKVILKNGTEIDKNLFSKFVDSLSVQDAATFKQCIKNNDYGIDDLRIVHPITKYEWEQPLPITESFFVNLDKNEYPDEDSEEEEIDPEEQLDEQRQTLTKQIFQLAYHGHISPEYASSLEITERNYLYQLLVEQLETEKKQSDQESQKAKSRMPSTPHIPHVRKR